MKQKLPYLLILPVLLGLLLVNRSPKSVFEQTTVSTSTPAPTPAEIVEEVVTTPEVVSTPEPTPEPTPAPPIPIDADGNFEVYGKTVNINDEFIDLSHMDIPDAGASVASMLMYMPNLKALDMDSCGVSNEDMAKIRDANPNIEVIWRINFGDNYSARTNVTMILASKPSKGGMLDNSVGEQLKYFTKCRYIDLGHNEDLSDFSFVKYMPDLEVAVISMCAITDLTPFASCSNLLYLEAGHTSITDLSPLASCSKLAHLNVGTSPGVTDISSLYDLPLRRLWLGVGDPVPQEQVDTMRQKHPECEVNTTCSTGLERNEKGEIISEGFTTEGWKYVQNYNQKDYDFRSQYGYFPNPRPIGYWKAVHKCFRYWDNPACYSFSWNDPNYEATEHTDPVNTYVIDLSILSEAWAEDPSTAHIADIYDSAPGDTIYVDPY